MTTFDYMGRIFLKPARGGRIGHRKFGGVSFFIGATKFPNVKMDGRDPTP